MTNVKHARSEITETGSKSRTWDPWTPTRPLSHGQRHQCQFKEILAQNLPLRNPFLQAEGRQDRKGYKLRLSYNVRPEVSGPPTREPQKSSGLGYPCNLRP